MNKIVLDTETINLANPFIFDLGFIVVDELGETISKHQYIIKEIYDNKALFEMAFYKSNREYYETILKKGIAKKLPLKKVMRQVKKILIKNGIVEIFAFNSAFDENAIAYTTKFFGVKNPLEQIIFKDIRKLAKLIYITNEYKDFIEKNNLYTPKGFKKTTAETTYQFITQNPNFVEHHTALRDCEIELQILNYIDLLKNR